MAGKDKIKKPPFRGEGRLGFRVGVVSVHAQPPFRRKEDDESAYEDVLTRHVTSVF
jgi:hypothetical protein